MIFIRYENNGYCFMHYIQENIIFHFTYAIFDERLFFINVLTSMQKSTNCMICY